MKVELPKDNELAEDGQRRNRKRMGYTLRISPYIQFSSHLSLLHAPLLPAATPDVCEKKAPILDTFPPPFFPSFPTVFIVNLLFPYQISGMC